MGRIVIELTNRCNLRCQHCFERRHGGNEDLPIEFIEHIVQNATPLGFEEFAFTGGEPTTHQHFFDVIQIVSRAGYKYGLVSNGWNFPKIYNKLLPFREQLTGITFSLDGAKENTHDCLRGNGSYRRLLKSMSICVFKEIPFTVNMVLTKINVDEVEELVVLASQLGSRAVRFGHYMHTSRPEDNDLALSFEERRIAEEAIYQLQSTSKIMAVMAPGYYTHELFPCAPLQMQEFNIDWQGNVSKCCHLSGYSDGADNDVIVGNLHNISLVDAITHLNKENDRFCNKKQMIHDAGRFEESDYFPCLYCSNTFNKLESKVHIPLDRLAVNTSA